ncbi:ComEC/Rec2 family competence protein [Candidatus Kaiserbacteria bacterium]|nr:ComEC/Rec2 family competence protein [Candidatus Kaiserbacteria bacterium]
MDKLLYILTGGFALGVLWHSFIDYGIWFSVFVLSLGFFILFTAFILENKHGVLVVGVLVLSVAFGLLRYDIANIHQGSTFVGSFIGQNIVAEGIVIDEPDARENNTNYTIRLRKVFNEEATEKIRVVAGSYPGLIYGDKVLISGELQKPKGFETDVGKYFDYAAFLSKDDIFYQMIFPRLEYFSSGHGQFVKQYLFSFKNAFLSQVQKLIPDPQVSLLGGLVVGAKQSLGEKLQKDFRTTGIIHIVVLSGYNVTIVADAIMRSLSFLPRVVGMSLGAGAIVLFALMTGGSATIVRASIMALLVIAARATGRTYDITRALFVAGFIMILHSPKILVHDASFQLSFLATLGLILLAPIIERRLWFVPSKFQFREFATATIATQIFVLPLLLYKMGTLSLVALPVNLLVLVTVPVTMLFGFLAGVIGFVSSVLATPFAFVAHLLLSYQLSIVELFARIPFASIQIDTFPLWLMVVFYVGYAIILQKIYIKT